MNSLTLKVFDVDRVEHMFLDMCITTGTNAATAETNFEKMDSVLKKDNIPWQNCVDLSVDNANVNMGVCNSIKSRILSINPTIYVHGCPCHIVHNNASAARTHYIEMRSYVKKLMSKFVTTTAIKNADVCEVEYKDKQNQEADHKLNVGWTTRTTLNRLHEAGEISQYQVDNFHSTVCMKLCLNVVFFGYAIPAEYGAS
ncbi:UNVERIFIED_CONTAM: hypothetical protein FKN15_034922 [Acipenser sinensis]